MTTDYGVIEKGFPFLQTPNKSYLKSLFPDSARFLLIIAVGDIISVFTERNESTMGLSIFKEKV